MGDCFAPLGPPLLPWDLMAHTDITTDIATPRPTRPSGAELVKNSSSPRECEFLTNIQNQVSDNLRSNVARAAHLICNIWVTLGCKIRLSLS